MSNKIIALVDCDSFFVSCEQSVNPELLDRPVCVVGSERGCVLARSKEAKQIGIPMGHPYFMAKKEFKDCIYVFGNYELYHNISKKFILILKDFSPTVEVYSIDEAFVELSGLKKLYGKNYYNIVKEIRERIKQELNINVSIGLSTSKVLAKLACEKAKKLNDGIFLIGQSKIKKVLPKTKVGEIWGIGKKTSLSLNRWGILNCDELVKKSDDWLKERIGKRGVELRHELLGECIDNVKTKRKPPKSIQNTRSFPEFTENLDYIKNALNIHIHNSCVRMRYLGGKCKTVGVMLRTKDFVISYEKKVLSESINFEIEITRIAIDLLNKIYLKDILYRSCGVTLDGIEYSTDNQLNLFADCKTKNFDKLACAIDNLEKKFGKNVVKTGFVE